MNSIKVFAPATVANVSCGFDVLGFAMDAPGDEVTLTLMPGEEVVVQEIQPSHLGLPSVAHLNTAGVAIQSFLRAIGRAQGVGIVLKKGLPLGSGMGSSAASAAAALVGINELMGSPLTRLELIPHAMEAERVACGSAHADNVAPALLGGFTLVREYQPLDVVKVPVKANLWCTLVHPQLEVRTEDSRRILRNSIPLKDAVAQAGNIAGLMVGLMEADYALIGRSLKDVIAEPARSVFIPGFDQLKASARDAGALGCGISGSGPTLFALSISEEIGLKCGAVIQAGFQRQGVACETYVSQINQKGAIVIG